MDICLPVDLLPGILVLLLALGQLLRPLHFRNVIFSIIMIELGYLHFIHMYIMNTERIISGSGLFLTAQPVFMSIGVFIYIYIKSLKNEINEFSQVNIKHFFTTIISAFAVIIYFAACSCLNTGSVPAFFTNRYPVLIFFMLSWISLACYITVSIIDVRNVLVRENPVHRVFRKLLFLLYMIFPAMAAGIITVVYTLPEDSLISRIYIIIISVILFSLYLLMHRNPYVIQYSTVPSRKTGRGKNLPSAPEIECLKKTITVIMEEEKLFCDEDLTLPRLSSALGITRHQLSSLLNDHFGKNFNSFINNYRISEARNMLVHEPKRSALSIAHAVGFNSYSVFYTSFKKETGHSPAEYRNRNLGRPGQ